MQAVQVFVQSLATSATAAVQGLVVTAKVAVALVATTRP